MVDKNNDEVKKNRPPLTCIGCHKSPDQLEEYIDSGRENGMTPEDYCWEEEGTLNCANGHFACTTCYIAMGMPSSPFGWKAP